MDADSRARPGHNQGPPIIAREMIEQAAHGMAALDTDIGAARGRYEYAKEMVKHIKAVHTAVSEASSFAARENEALASSRYRSAIDELRDAAIAFETAKARRETYAMHVDIWRTEKATARAGII